jgi:hypothetical protein
MRTLSRPFALILLAGLAMAQPALRLKSWQGEATGRVQVSAVLKTRTPGRSHWIVQFPANPTEAQVKELARRGAAVLSYVPDFALSISARDETDLEGLGVRWVGRLEPGEKISPALVTGGVVSAVVEFYADVDPGDARATVTDAGLVIHENPDLLQHHLLVSGRGEQLRSLAEWDEVSYIFPASAELLRGTPVRGCVGALTTHGLVGQGVALADDGWDGPGLGSADLKYAFAHVTEKLPADATEGEIVRALSQWAKYAKLTFTASNDSKGARTIAVLFASGAHGDGYPFDGPGGVLAHTFYPVPTNPEPIAGDMHFDEAESWKIGANVDVFSIALHESGHSFGLGHSDNPGDVMYPYYHIVTGLAQGDIAAILKLYAPQDVAAPPDPRQPPAPPPPPPALVLTAQAPASPTTASSIAMSGTVSGGSGLLQVNWRTSQGFIGSAQGGSAWTIAAIPLAVGNNVITILARDAQQDQVAQSFNVTRQSLNPPSPGNPVPPPRPPTGNRPPANPPAGNPTNPAPGNPTDKTPPSITILSPAMTNVATSAGSIVVSGAAQDNVGVAQVTWSSSTGGAGVASGTDHWATTPIPLYVGTTTIIIRASDAAGNTSWRSLMVTRN